MLGGEGELGGLIEVFGFLSFAGVLQGAEFFQFLFATAGEAVFLQMEIAQVFFLELADKEFEGGLRGG